jgi:hypothetical protein
MQETPKPQTNSTSDTKTQRFVVSLFQALPHLIATLLVAEYCRLVVAGFVKFFDQHDTLLPAITIQYYRFALAINSLPRALLTGIALLDVLFIFMLASLPKRFRWLSYFWIFGYLVAVMLFLYFGGIAMGLPLFPIDMAK